MCIFQNSSCLRNRLISEAPSMIFKLTENVSPMAFNKEMLKETILCVQVLFLNLRQKMKAGHPWQGLDSNTNG